MVATSAVLGTKARGVDLGTELAMKLPNFLIVGAARAGTTSIYEALSRHPQVYMPVMKEPNYFAVSGGETGLPLTSEALRILLDVSIDSLDQYRSLFRGAEAAKMVGEASPLYLYSPLAPTRIRELIPDVKIIAVLREPVERAYSSFLRGVGDASTPKAFVEEALREQAELEHGTSRRPVPLLAGGLYSVQLRRYFALFDRSQIEVFLFEELWGEQANRQPELYRYLDLEPMTFSGAKHNQSGIMRSRGVDRAIRRVSGRARRLRTFIPGPVGRVLKTARQKIREWNTSDAPGVPVGIKNELYSRFFEDDVAELEALLNKNLSSWRT